MLAPRVTAAWSRHCAGVRERGGGGWQEDVNRAYLKTYSVYDDAADVHSPNFLAGKGAYIESAGGSSPSMTGGPTGGAL